MPSRLTKLAGGTAAASALAALVALPTTAQGAAPADLNLQFGASRDIFLANDPANPSDNIVIPLGDTVTMQAGGSLNFTMAGTNHQPVIYQVRAAETATQGLDTILGRANARVGTGRCVTDLGGCTAPTNFAPSLSGGDRQDGNLFLGDRIQPTARILGAGDYVVYCNNPNHASTGAGRNMRIVVQVEDAAPTP